ncbi:hypothetical protein D3C72_2445870 [compost metagenome]
MALKHHHVALCVAHDVVVAIKESGQATQGVTRAGHEDLQAKLLEVAHGGHDIPRVHLDEGLVDYKQPDTGIVAALQPIG